MKVINSHVKVTVTRHRHLRVYIENLLSISVPADGLKIQARIIAGVHHIDYHCADGQVIESNYIRRDLWARILKALEKTDVI